MTFWEFTSSMCLGLATGLLFSYFKKKEGDKDPGTVFFIKITVYGLLAVFIIQLGTRALFLDKTQLNLARSFIWLAFGVFIYLKTRAISAPKAD